MKFLLKYKTWILTFLFVTPLLLSLYVQYDENVKKYNYWNYEVLEKLNIATKEEINSLNNEDAVAKFKDEKKEIIKKFLPTSEQYKDFACYKKFNTNTDGTLDIIINSLGVLQFGRINDECFTDESKQILFVSYLFIYFAIFFTIIVLFTDKIRRLIPYKNHIAIIGLNKYSREIIEKTLKNENIKIYDNNNTNKYISELEDSGEIIITGKLEYTIESNKCEILNAKDIYIINNSDAESLNNLALILSKFDNSNNRKIKDKTKIYIEIKNRENKAFFDKKGIYNLISDYYEIYPFSINEIIVQEMFKDKPLISNIKNKNGKYEENLKILIVGFNDLSEEILYNILKLGHFDLKRIVEVTVIDDKYEILNCKYKTIIERGKKPYENSNESLWNLEFLPYKSLYDNRIFNRIILCDKELDNGIDILNYINNNYHVQIREKNTIIQVFNEHKNVNNTINSDKNNFKNFSTFGDIETTITLDNIKNNNLYKVAEYTNDFKEIDESKKWKNIDNFTRESNITEKLHMDIKLNHFGLKINSCFSDEKIDNLINSYYERKKQNIADILDNNEIKNKFKQLPNVFDNFAKDYKEDKFELFNNLKLDSNWSKEIEDKFNNGLGSKITIADLFKIIAYDRNKEELFIKRKKLKLLIQNLCFSYNEKFRNDFDKLIEILKEYDNLENEIIDISSEKFQNIKKYYIPKIKNLELKTRKDYIDFFNTLKDKSKEKETKDVSEEDFIKIINEFESLDFIKIMNESKKELDIFYDKYKNVKVDQKFIDSENNKFKLNACILLSSLELFLKYNKDDIESIINNLAEVEHTRWNAYHILNGWTRRKIAEKDMLKKEHFDLCDWETLKKDDSRVVKYDYKNIYQIPFVAYCLGFEIVEIEEKI